MTTCKSILNKLKHENLPEVYKDIQVFFKDGIKTKCSEVCEVFKGVYQLISTREHSKDEDFRIFISHIIPIIDYCVELTQNNFSPEDLSKHQFFIVLYHTIKLLLKFSVYSPALTCAECMRILLFKTSDVLVDKHVYIKNVWVSFWNEALQAEKENEFVTAFKLRCKSIEFLLLEDASNMNEKISLTLKRYCQYHKKKESVEILEFLQNIWNHIYSKKADFDQSLNLLKFFYLLSEILLKSFKDDASVYQALLGWISDILNINFPKGPKQTAFQICGEVLKFSFQSFLLRQDLSITKVKLKQFEKLSVQINPDDDFRIYLFSYTLAIFNFIFVGNFLTTETHQDNAISWTKCNLDICISMCRSYLEVSSLFQHKGDLPFSFHLDITITYTMVNLFTLLLKTDNDCLQKPYLILTAQNFIKHAVCKLKLKMSNNSEKMHSSCASAIGNIGLILYSSNLYTESCYFLETSCDLLSNYPVSDLSIEDIKRSLWKKREVLVYSYYSSANYHKALQVIVQILLLHKDKLKDSMKLWTKVKRAAMRVDDKQVISSTISDILLDIKAEVSEAEEINFLLEELKYCKFERCCMEEEIIAIGNKLFNLPCQNVSRALFFVEILTMPTFIQEKICSILNLSVLEICSESINLYKEYLKENPLDSTVKIELSIAYFWLYNAHLQLLHKFIERETIKSTDLLPEEKEDNAEENVTEDITPAFPFVTFSVEVEMLQSLDSALELWTQISEDPNQTWRCLVKKIIDWDLLSIINTTAEIFSTSAHDLKELKCWILLHNIASVVENKGKEIISSISLVNFLIRFGYFESASHLLNYVESLFLTEANCPIDIQVLRLKSHLAKSKLYLHTGKFDEGLSVLQSILNDPLLEKHFKSTKMLQVDSLLLKTQFLLVPPKAYFKLENLKYLQRQTAITAALEGAALAKGLLKSISEKENSENSKNDWMVFKVQLLKNILMLYLQLGDLNFQVGEVRFAKCYLQEGLKLAQANLLTYWTSKVLIVLGQLDLLCDNTKDCLVKLNGLKYITDESSKENASWLLSKIKEVTISESSSISEDFFLDSKLSVKFSRSIKQHFINNSDVFSSPVQKKEGKTLTFEVKPPSSLAKNMFSFYALKMEIWALSCYQLLSDGETSIAENQLNKLYKTCDYLKELFIISDIFCLENVGPSLNGKHSKVYTGPEIMLPILTLHKLSLVHIIKNSFEKVKSVIEEALIILNQSSENAKYLYPNIYACLQYNNIIAKLKKLLLINGNSNIEYMTCPSVKSNIFVRKNPKLEKLSVCQTPPRSKAVPEIVISSHPYDVDLCNAPFKKDVLPGHVAKDIQTIEAATKFTPLVFSSSSDEDFTTNSAKINSVSTCKTSDSTPVRLNGKQIKSYKLFKSKNSKVEIKSSCDIWKYSVTTTPKSSKRQLRAQLAQSTELKVDSRKTKAKSKKGSTSSLKSAIAKAPKKVKQSRICTKIFSDNVEEDSVINESNFHSPLKEQISIECNRSFTEKKDRTKDSPGSAFDNMSELFNSIEYIPKLDSPVDELCQDLNSINLARDTSEEIIKIVSDEDFNKIVDDLENIRCLIEHNAHYPLYPNTCKLLAVLLIAKKENKTSETLKEIGFLLSQTISSTFEQVYLNNVLYSKNKMEVGKKISHLLKTAGSSLSKQMERYLNPIPRDWTVVQINALQDKDLFCSKSQRPIFAKLVITQYQFGYTPLIVCVDSSATSRFISTLFSEFDDILLQSTLIMKNTDSSRKWWQTRSTLDARLKSLLSCMENSWLGCWKGLLLGTSINNKRQKEIKKSTDLISNISKPFDERLLKVLLDSATFLNREQLSASICHLWNCTPFDEIYSKVFKCITEETIALTATERNPVILMLDKDIQALPWENIPILSGTPVSRMPSLAILSAQLTMYDSNSTFHKGIDCDKTFYILNPGGDLINSQETFEEKFKMQTNWNGLVARAPQSLEYSNALRNNDLFLYCGHGSGRQYLDRTSINKLECRASAILMGCSSGRLKQLGSQLEAHGFPLMYLMSGSPCVIGNLWDVTDKDIDRFTNKFLELLVPNYCQENISITDTDNAVSQARNACKMRYLVGAAPVIYGFPVFAKR